MMSLDQVGNSLVASIKERDWESVDQLAHRLKSSSLSTGALAVWSLCKNIESARMNDDITQPAGHADEMTHAIEKCAMHLHCRCQRR